MLKQYMIMINKSRVKRVHTQRMSFMSSSQGNDNIAFADDLHWKSQWCWPRYSFIMTCRVVFFFFVSQPFHWVLCHITCNIRGRRCSNYIFILNLTPVFNGFGKYKCKTRPESLMFGDLVWLILDIYGNHTNKNRFPVNDDVMAWKQSLQQSLCEKYPTLNKVQ